ncbi:BatA domain-containing protein [Allomuricauda sp. d1]|uniref:BatA domain-containing protein n=1 Tax=Allomuricauda sp. d1 TaxID=3136725 RepID=UPI0031D9733A
MQFKHPEILWALLLLLIPIFIHLFQLRRFKKTPFTNVAMLQKVVSESRKSNQLKKWLLLLSRLGLLAALVFAFAQPFSAETTALTPKETVIYLDNSFSMQAKKNGFSLLESAVQELAKSIDEETSFSLFTNNKTFRETTIKDVQNELLALRYSHNQLNMDAVRLKAGTLFKNNDATVKQLIVLSDFQNRSIRPDTVSTIKEYLVALQADAITNVSLDSLFFDDSTSSASEITVRVSGASADENIPISLYNGENLIAKSSANLNEDGNAEAVFSLPTGQTINGRVFIVDGGLSYDNTLYFNIDAKHIINVMGIASSDGEYLRRLFPQEEFNLTLSSLDQLDYSQIDRQNLIVLDGLAQIPTSLQRVLKNFYDDGGSLVIIPSNKSEVTTYNSLLSNFTRIQFGELISETQKISEIAFDHPLYRNVFEKRIRNFQNPEVNNYFSVNSNVLPILSFQGGAPFLTGGDRLYVFTAPIDDENSNFKNSPLIVPTFYNMAVQSLQSPEPYFRISEPATVDIEVSLGPDNILSLSKEDVELIPRQQSYTNKVSLFFDDSVAEAGIYQVKDKDSVYRNISFNYPRNESELRYAETENSDTDISSLFERLKVASEVTPYWKWFVILALVFALLEVLIQKFVA